MPLHILLLNGPNLNLLGTREPHIYGVHTLRDVENLATTRAAAHDCTLESFQSNHEGLLVDHIQAARGYGANGAQVKQLADAIIINPGAFTHTSVALRDALCGVAVPFVEVHISNIHAREEWRNKSYLSDKAVAVVAGMGVFGYEAAVEFVARTVKPADQAHL